MPKINQINQIDITPQKFIDACSELELVELDLLLGSNRYQSIIKKGLAKQTPERIKLNTYNSETCPHINKMQHFSDVFGPYKSCLDCGVDL